MRNGAQRGSIADCRAVGEWKGIFTGAIRFLAADLPLQTKFDLVQLCQVMIEAILRFLISGALQIVQGVGVSVTKNVPTPTRPPSR